MLTNDAKAVIALTTRLGSRDRPSLSPKKWHLLATALSDSGRTPSDVFDRNLSLDDVPGIDPELAESVTRLVGDGASATLEADDLSRKGIWIVTIVDDEYPRRLVERLRSNAPPVLFGVGDKDLFMVAGVGVVGSRDAGVEAAGIAREVATQAVGLGRSVVSGGARGVDQLAMNAAFAEGGRVIGVLADSLQVRIRKPDTLQALDGGNICLVSHQTPSSGFTPAAAMSRNKLIYGLSEVTVIVSTDLESGGTWAGATEALNAHNGLVAVWRGEGEGPGNQELERRGAIPIKTAEDLGSLLDRPPPTPPQQLSLTE